MLPEHFAFDSAALRVSMDVDGYIISLVDDKLANAFKDLVGADRELTPADGKLSSTLRKMVSVLIHSELKHDDNARTHVDAAVEAFNLWQAKVALQETLK